MSGRLRSFFGFGAPQGDKPDDLETRLAQAERIQALQLSDSVRKIRINCVYVFCSRRMRGSDQSYDGRCRESLKGDASRICAPEFTCVHLILILGIFSSTKGCISVPA